MDFALTDDQAQVLDAIEALARPYADVPAESDGFHLYSAELDAALEEAGFLDIAAVEELGPITAVLAAERIAALPFCVEFAASALLRPLLPPDLPRPLCLIDARDGSRPVRFLPVAATALILDGEEVRAAPVDAGMVAPVDSLFAYPMGRFRDGNLPRGDRVGIATTDLRRLWRIALAAEMGGLLQGALDSTIRHVSERQQFGRPLGAFQGVRHRLAEAAVKIEGTRLLARRAALTGLAEDAALASFQAQDSAPAIVYDLHQFLGAMGVTLEHPLHFWTYRAKALLSELGGRGDQAVDATATE